LGVCVPGTGVGLTTGIPPTRPSITLRMMTMSLWATAPVESVIPIASAAADIPPLIFPRVIDVPVSGHP
jgi:hypothetical protein